MKTTNKGKLYRASSHINLASFLRRSLYVPDDAVAHLSEVDVYEVIKETGYHRTLLHLQSELTFILTNIEFYNMFNPYYDDNEVILKPNDNAFSLLPSGNVFNIVKYLKGHANVTEITGDDCFFIKANKDDFYTLDGQCEVKIQYYKEKGKFRDVKEILRKVDKRVLLDFFHNPRYTNLGDMNLFDRVTLGKFPDKFNHIRSMDDKYEGIVYYMGYSIDSQRARVVKSDVVKSDFTEHRQIFLLVEHEYVDALVRKGKVVSQLSIESVIDEAVRGITEEVDKETAKSMESDEWVKPAFNVVNTEHTVIYPKVVGDGLVITLGNGVIHMLVNNIALVKGESFRVIEVGKRGNVGVWGSGFDSMMDYYKGLDKLKLQISRIDHLSDFSLVNKVLLNK